MMHKLLIEAVLVFCFKSKRGYCLWKLMFMICRIFEFVRSTSLEPNTHHHLGTNAPIKAAQASLHKYCWRGWYADSRPAADVTPPRHARPRQGPQETQGHARRRKDMRGHDARTRQETPGHTRRRQKTPADAKPRLDTPIDATRRQETPGDAR